jgi:hypothetical protein
MCSARPLCVVRTTFCYVVSKKINVTHYFIRTVHRAKQTELVIADHKPSHGHTACVLSGEIDVFQVITCVC